MKVLFLNEYSKPHIVSGAERSMLALSKALNKNIEVFTLSPNLSPSKTRLEGNHLKFSFPIKIKPGETLSPIWFNNPVLWIYTAFFITKTIKTKKITLIHVHGKYIQPAAVIASWFTKVKVVTTVRDFKFLCPLALCFTNEKPACSFKYYLNSEVPQYQKHYHQTSRLKLVLAKIWQYILKWFLNQSEKVIAVSPQLAKIYQTAGIKNTTSIYNLPPIKQTLSRKSKSRKTIVSIGKLSYGKGTDSIVKAAAKLPEYNFILAGPKNISLKNDFPSNLKYLGKVPHKKALALYKQADVFIINSRWPEPLSRAGLEALSFGLPVIASNRGGNQELVSNNGLLVNPNKPSEIARAIKSIFNKDLLKLSKNSQKLFQTRFNQSAIINKHLSLYQKLSYA